MVSVQAIVRISLGARVSMSTRLRAQNKTTTRTWTKVFIKLKNRKVKDKRKSMNKTWQVKDKDKVKNKGKEYICKDKCKQKG